MYCVSKYWMLSMQLSRFRIWQNWILHESWLLLKYYEICCIARRLIIIVHDVLWHAAVVVDTKCSSESC